MTDTPWVTQGIKDRTATAQGSQKTFSICHKENFQCAESNRSALIFVRKWCKCSSCNKYCRSVFKIYSKGFRTTSANTVLFTIVRWTHSLWVQKEVYWIQIAETQVFHPRTGHALPELVGEVLKALKLQAKTWIKRFFSFLGKWLWERVMSLTADL